jgi:alcohol dehydrogenase
MSGGGDGCKEGIALPPVTYFQAATRLAFGDGALSESGAIFRECQAARPLLVTDQGMVKAGIVELTQMVLAAAGVSAVLFDRVEPDPSIETVQAAAREFRANGCDSVLAVGGGSPMDCAKAAAVLVSTDGRLEDYFGINKVCAPLPPLVAVPTTVGTGSEVTTFAVISDLARCKKMVIGSPRLAPLCN